MELLCSWCGVSLTTTPWVTTYDPCGHNICHGCYLFYHRSRVCVVCTFKNPATKGGIPETHSRTPQPRPPLLRAPPPSALPHPTPDLTNPSRNTTRTNTTHPSTSQNHTPETGFSSSPHKEGSCQSSLRQTGDPRRLNYSQQGEWDREMGQPGTVRRLKEKFDSGIVAPQEGAAGWKKSEEDPRAAQGSIQTLVQQEPISRSKDPHQPDNVIGINSSAQHGKEQKTPHIRKTKNRGSPPYPPKSPKDEYLDSSRETLPSPPRSRNASPSPCSTNDRSRISSSPQWPAQRSRSCPRTRETERSSSSHTSPRDPSPSPSRPTNLPPAPSLARKPSPAPTHCCLSARSRETGHSSPSLTSSRPPSPSLTSSRPPSPSPSRPTNLPPSPSSAGKSSPAPTTPKESFAFNSAGKDVKFPGKAIRGGSVEGAAPPSRTPTQQPHIKPALIPTVAKVVNDDLPQHHQTSRDLGDGLNHKTQGMEMKERGSVGLKHEDNRQQSESFAHEEKDRKRQEDYAQLREPNVGQQNESQVEELTVSGGQIKTLTRENVELKEKVTALREAKDRAEKEAMNWKEENAKQQEAARQEMDHFRKEQVQRLQEHYDNWEGRMKEMQAQITSQEQEKKQLREKSNRLENNLYQVIEDLARCKEYTLQLERENAHQQQEIVKYGEEEMWLREQIHTKDAQLEEAVGLYYEEIEKMKAAEEEEITRLILKDIQNQEELATLRSSKEDARCLIRERDTLQEEVDKLQKEETIRKKKMARLRGERDDYRMKLNELENTVTSLSRNLSEKVSACQREIHELKSKEATLHEEATQLRRERDLYRDEAKERENSYIDKINELKWSENKITELQQERDNLKGEVDQLKQATSTEIRKERDSYKEEIKRLNKEVSALEYQVTDLRRERDSYKEALHTLEEELSALEYEMKVVRRERDSYKEEADRLKTREEQFNQMTERDINRRMEESRMAQMELKIQNYKTKIAELEGNNNTLKKQMEREKENHQQKVDAETSRLRKENERFGGYRRREETLGKQIEEMETEKEDLIQQLLRERDEVQKLERRENALETQLTETKTDRDMYKRERDEYKQTADKLVRNNSTLTTERDCCISEREKERGKHKEEVERLKRTHNNEMRLREERDRYKREVQRLKEELEVASGAATTRHMEVIWPKKDLEVIPPPPAPSHGAEDIEMVTVGLRRKEEEDEEEVATLGLPNLGNSCYINGVVQCLYHLPPLRNTLAQCTDLQYQDQPGKGVAHALAQLFWTMRSGDNSVIRFPLRELKQVLGSHDEAFGGKRQQEAHDLFSAIATWLHSDLRQYDAPDTSHGSSLFEGWLETRIVCPEQGKTLAPNKETFTSISLPVVGVNTWSLKALLDKHFRTQTLEWDCDSCHYPHQCDHSTRLLTCPHVLVIHFSRVRDSKTRRKTKVDFPVSELSLQKYMVSDSPRSPTYKLVGVVCHHGSMGGGHYTAYCRYRKGPWGNRWRFCNDDRVWDVDERQVLSDENAHLLFYIQQ